MPWWAADERLVCVDSEQTGGGAAAGVAGSDDDVADREDGRVHRGGDPDVQNAAQTRDAHHGELSRQVSYCGLLRIITDYCGLLRIITDYYGFDSINYDNPGRFERWQSFWFYFSVSPVSLRSNTVVCVVYMYIQKVEDIIRHLATAVILYWTCALCFPQPVYSQLTVDNLCRILKAVSRRSTVDINCNTLSGILKRLQCLPTHGPGQF